MIKEEEIITELDPDFIERHSVEFDWLMKIPEDIVPMCKELMVKRLHEMFESWDFMVKFHSTVKLNDYQIKKLKEMHILMIDILTMLDIWKNEYEE